jgi:hypothetical protein
MLKMFKQKRVLSSVGRAQEKEYIKDKVAFGATAGVATVLSPIELPDEKLSYAQNILLLKNKIKSRYGYATFGNGLPLPSPVVDIEQFFKYDGSQYLVIFTTTDAYVYNTGTKYWDLITDNLLVDDTSVNWTAQPYVSSSVVTSWLRYGSSSIKFVIGSGFTGDTIATHTFESQDISVYTHIHLYIKSSVDMEAGDLLLVLATVSSAVEVVAFPKLSANVATEAELKLANPSSDDQIVIIGIQRKVNAGAQTIYINDIRAVNCFTGTTEDRFNCESIFNSLTSEMYFIATNGIDNVKFWTGTGNWADLDGSPNKAKYVKNFYNYLLLLNVTVSPDPFPQRIDWSVNTKPTDWSNAGSGNNSLASSTGKIMGCEIIQGQLAIFLERSIAIMYIVGSVYQGTQTPIPFTFDENKVLEIGCAAAGSIQSLGDTILFLGWDDFYLFDGFSCTPLGNDIIQDFLDSLNASKLTLVHSHIIEELNLYIIFIPTANSEVTDTAWIYDYRQKIFLGVWKFTNNFSCDGYYSATDAKTIGSVLDKIGTVPWRIGSSQLSAYSAINLFGDDDGYIYNMDKLVTSDNGNAIDSYIDTKAYASEMAKFIRLISFFLYGVGTSVDILVSTDDGKTFVQKGNIAFSGNSSTPNKLQGSSIDTTAESLIFRMRNNVLNGWFEIIGWMYRYIEKEKDI